MVDPLGLVYFTLDFDLPILEPDLKPNITQLSYIQVHCVFLPLLASVLVYLHDDQYKLLRNRYAVPLSSQRFIAWSVPLCSGHNTRYTSGPQGSTVPWLPQSENARRNNERRLTWEPLFEGNLSVTVLRGH